MIAIMKLLGSGSEHIMLRFEFLISSDSDMCVYYICADWTCQI